MENAKRYDLCRINMLTSLCLTTFSLKSFQLLQCFVVAFSMNAMQHRTASSLPAQRRHIKVRKKTGLFVPVKLLG